MTVQAAPAAHACPMRMPALCLCGRSHLHHPSALWPSGKPDHTADAAVKGNQQDMYWMGMDAALSAANIATHGMCNQHKSMHVICTTTGAELALRRMGASTTM